MVYVDDGIFLGNNDAYLLQAIKEIQGLGLNIEDQGQPAYYVGVSIKKHCNGFYEFTQCTLIDSIIEDACISNSRTKPVVAKVSFQLHTFFKNEQVFDLDFNHRSVVGKLNYFIRNSTMSLTTLVLCFFISQLCFWDHEYVFHLVKVFYHLVKAIFNLYASMYVTICPNLANFCTSSHVLQEMSHMASLVYYKFWDFCFFVLYRILFKFIMFYSKCPKWHTCFFSFLSNSSCINRLKKSFL